MAAPASEPRWPAVLQDAPRLTGWCAPPRCAGDCTARTYLDDGRRICWRPGAVRGRYAVDAERVREVRPALARRLGADDFWSRWTATEADVKARGEPMLVTVKTGLRPAPGTVVRTELLHVAGIEAVLSWAWCPTARCPDGP